MKKIDSVQKLTENRHLNLYHLDARDRKGNFSITILLPETHRKS